MSFCRVAPLFCVLVLVQAAPEECQRRQDHVLLQIARPASNYTPRSSTASRQWYWRRPVWMTRRRALGESLQNRGPAPAPPAPNAPCAYDFEPPSCKSAEVQSPRDLRPDALGHRRPKAATLNDKQAESLPLTNIHFHLGAEHRSSEYNSGVDTLVWEERDLTSPRPGWMCDTTSLPESQLQPYEFQHCGAYVEVGKTYEIHWVHSSAGYAPEDIAGLDIDPISDGLGGAANGRGLLNPMIAVDAQVVLITNGGSDDFELKASHWTPDGATSVMYPGSTTGTSFNNTICSPYGITWHVDTRCYKITAESFDRFCEELRNKFGIEEDLNAHGSRVLVDPAYVAPKRFVEPLL